MKKIINICSAIFMIANVLLSLWFYFTTDEIYVPEHWSFGGNVDRYGQTWLILPLSGISVGVYLLLLYCQKHGIANLPFAIINKVKTKPIISHMIAWVTLPYHPDLSLRRGSSGTACATSQHHHLPHFTCHHSCYLPFHNADLQGEKIASG